MNRRSFLKWLGVGSAAVVVAPAAVKAVEPSLSDPIKGWVSYSEIYPNVKTTFDLRVPRA
jgi:hypothetical protein